MSQLVPVPDAPPESARAASAPVVTRHQKMAARMAMLHDLLHDPTVPITTLDILSGREPDMDRTVGLRLVHRAGRGAALGSPASPPPSPASEEQPSEGSTSTDIDPRMRARRISVRREAGRRRLRWVAVVGSLLGAMVVAWLVSRTPLLDVDRVAVVGAERTPASEVIDAAAVPLGQALLDVDLDAAAARVDGLAWVAAVAVERHWPGTVVVRVEERQPVAVAPLDEGEWAVLSADGRVMEVTPQPPAGLVPLVDVPPVSDDGGLDPAAADALAVARLLPSSLAPRVVGIGPGGAAGVELRLDPGVVRIGPPTDLVDKLVAADAVLAQAPGRCVAVVDVRVPDTPVLTLLPGCG